LTIVIIDYFWPYHKFANHFSSSHQTKITRTLLKFIIVFCIDCLWTSKKWQPFVRVRIIIFLLGYEVIVHYLGQSQKYGSFQKLNFYIRSSFFLTIPKNISIMLRSNKN
jgi:hypothetical protein